MKLFQNLSSDLAEEVVKSLFLFIALAAILFNIAQSFEQFWKSLYEILERISPVKEAKLRRNQCFPGVMEA